MSRVDGFSGAIPKSMTAWQKLREMGFDFSDTQQDPAPAKRKGPPSAVPVRRDPSLAARGHSYNPGMPPERVEQEGPFDQLKQTPADDMSRTAAAARGAAYSTPGGYKMGQSNSKFPKQEGPFDDVQSSLNGAQSVANPRQQQGQTGGGGGAWADIERSLNGSQSMARPRREGKDDDSQAKKDDGRMVRQMAQCEDEEIDEAKPNWSKLDRQRNMQRWGTIDRREADRVRLPPVKGGMFDRPSKPRGVVGQIPAGSDVPGGTGTGMNPLMAPSAAGPATKPRPGWQDLLDIDPDADNGDDEI